MAYYYGYKNKYLPPNGFEAFRFRNLLKFYNKAISKEVEKLAT